MSHILRFIKLFVFIIFLPTISECQIKEVMDVRQINDVKGYWQFSVDKNNVGIIKNIPLHASLFLNFGTIKCLQVLLSKTATGSRQALWEY